MEDFKQAFHSLEEFKVFDADGDDKIDADELEKIVRFLNSKVTEEQVQSVMSKVDSDGNGSIELNEFLEEMKNGKSECDFEKAFLHFQNLLEDL